MKTELDIEIEKAKTCVAGLEIDRRNVFKEFIHQEKSIRRMFCVTYFVLGLNIGLFIAFVLCCALLTKHL